MNIIQRHKVILAIIIFCFTCQLLQSQDRKTHNNYTGNWESPLSWDPAWLNPQTNVNNLDVTINGYITANSSLTFSGSSKLIIDDTLVIFGDLTILNGNQLLVNKGGVLIVRGNLTFHNKSDIKASGYIVITGNLTKVGTISEGSFKDDDDDPVRVFIGGTVSPQSLLNDQPDFESLNCLNPSDPYPHSGCNYGYMDDLANDQVYQFFLTTCINPTAGSNSPLCPGNTLTLFSSGGSGYSWTGPQGFTSSEQNPAIPAAGTEMTGIYTVIITSGFGCTSEIEVEVTIMPPVTGNTITGDPVICYMDSAELSGESDLSGGDGEFSFKWESAGSDLVWETAAGNENNYGYNAPPVAVKTFFRRIVFSGNNGMCRDTSNIFTMDLHPMSYAELTGTGDTICAGGQSELRFSLLGEGPWDLVYSDGTEKFYLEAISSSPHVSHINPTAQDSATYNYQIVSLTDKFGCSAPEDNISGIASITVYAYPEPDPGYSVDVCGNIVHLNANLHYDNGVWHSEAVNTVFDPGPYHPDAVATVTEYGRHKFTYTETNWQCSASTDISVSFFEQPEKVYAGYEKILQFIFETDLEAVLPENLPEAYGIWDVVKGNGKIDFKNDPRTRVTNMGFGENTFKWTVYNGVCEPVSEPVTILIKDLGIPNAFSPNNSGLNDRFIIQGIENSSFNNFTVFNRQGNTVFKADNYRNEWDGRNHNGVPLREDTFFFILNVENRFSYKGFIVLKR